MGTLTVSPISFGVGHFFVLKGEPHVVDDCCNTDNFVAAGVGEQLHDGRIHPYPAGDRRYRSAAQYHSGPENHVVNEKSFAKLRS
jgi:hypothetical protein